MEDETDYTEFDKLISEHGNLLMDYVPKVLTKVTSLVKGHKDNVIEEELDTLDIKIKDIEKKIEAYGMTKKEIQELTEYGYDLIIKKLYREGKTQEEMNSIMKTIMKQKIGEN